jgi:hypothetical protein
MYIETKMWLFSRREVKVVYGDGVVRTGQTRTAHKHARFCVWLLVHFGVQRGLFSAHRSFSTPLVRVCRALSLGVEVRPDALLHSRPPGYCCAARQRVVY